MFKARCFAFPVVGVYSVFVLRVWRSGIRFEGGVLSVPVEGRRFFAQAALIEYNEL